MQPLIKPSKIEQMHLMIKSDDLLLKKLCWKFYKIKLSLKKITQLSRRAFFYCEKCIPFTSHTPSHPSASHHTTSHTQHNTQGPKAPKNLTRGPISVLKLWVAISQKTRLIRKYFLCLKLRSEAWLHNESKTKIWKFWPKILLSDEGKISRRGCRRSTSGVHSIERLYKTKS